MILRLEEIILEYNLAFLGPFALGLYPAVLLAEEANVHSFEVPDSDLAGHSPCCPEDPDLSHFVATSAKADLEFRVSL